MTKPHDMIPAPLPPDSIYTSCYCEENIYLLCQAFLQNEKLSNLWEIYVVFISNTNKTVALWYQKAACSVDAPMIWDYHVILMLRPRKLNTQVEPTGEQPRSWVYDFDTRLSTPCQWEEYFDLTLPEGRVLPAYESQFRVISGDIFLQHFASDRSHMRVVQETVDVDASQSKETEAIYFSPPPTYNPICGPGALQGGITNNLMSDYVVMMENLESNSEIFYGVVLDREGIDRFFTQ